MYIISLGNVVDVDDTSCTMFSNNRLTLALHKQCFGGAGQDFVMRFNQCETDINDIISISSSMVKMLIDGYLLEGKAIKGRLVARVVYISMNSEEKVVYYHPSYQTACIHDSDEFFTQHMLKIAQRMDKFNQNGSNLIIDNIEEIHLHFSILN